MPRQRVEVSAAVLQQPDGRFLLAQRPPGKAYAGYWEFPGGKIEPGEQPEQALARELHEELGVDVRCAYRWLTRDYEYEHAAVRLHFFRVTAWSGTLHGRERQAFAWQTPGALSVAPMLPANAPILAALSLPTVYGVSNVAELGVETFLGRLESALQRGLELVQLREKTLPPAALRDLAARTTALAHRYGARVLVNSDVALATSVGADGVHWTARDLMQALARPPACGLVGASCHDATELAQAAALGLDFAVLGPVAATPSHPGAATLGWDEFSRLTADYPLPVYAIGGMRAQDLAAAWRAGAHGIASMRDVWALRGEE